MSVGAVPALRPIAAAPRAPVGRVRGFLASLRGRRLYQTYLRAIPLLWILGVLAPAGALALVKLARERWPRGAMINVIVWSWFAIGLSQACAAILNGVALGEYARGFANAFGFGVVGWIFGGLAIAAGAAHRLDDARSIRAVCWVGFYMLMLAGVAALGVAAHKRELYVWPTPAGMLLPKSPSVTFYTAALIYQTEETLGELSTRLVLFFPWAPALGLGALAVTFISLLERNLPWRLLGAGGGAVGVVFSWSRIAIAALVVVGAFYAFLRAPRFVKLAVVGAGLCGLFALPLAGIDPLAEVAQIQDDVNGARAGSSLARELIYQKSFEGFLASPLIGNGWIGESVHAKENLPIGSHSTIYGLLYTGGAPTFAAFVLAMAATLCALLWRCATLKAGDPRLAHAQAGLCLALCLALYCRYEALFNLTLPCVFLFVFIGAALARSPDAAPAARADDGRRALAPRPIRAPRALDLNAFASGDSNR
ncbi:O-antigen ligase family protein [Methylocella sp.]|uniref:O-antigen ligase family protein n=1 Tax=Methylocella sp. TaxID=1978226 RepID=UPI0035AD902D